MEGKTKVDDWMIWFFYGLMLFLTASLLFYILFLGVKSLSAQTIVREKYFTLGVREITVYHAITAECDLTPDEGANGRVAIGGVPTGNWAACNWLPFGTKIILPALTGNTVWTVKDRMNKRVGHRIDLLWPLGEPGIGVRHIEVLQVKGESL